MSCRPLLETVPEGFESVIPLNFLDECPVAHHVLLEQRLQKRSSPARSCRSLHETVPEGFETVPAPTILPVPLEQRLQKLSSLAGRFRPLHETVPEGFETVAPSTELPHKGLVPVPLEQRLQKRSSRAMSCRPLLETVPEGFESVIPLNFLDERGRRYLIQRSCCPVAHPVLLEQRLQKLSSPAGSCRSLHETVPEGFETVPAPTILPVPLEQR